MVHAELARSCTPSLLAKGEICPGFLHVLIGNSLARLTPLTLRRNERPIVAFVVAAARNPSQTSTGLFPNDADG